MIPPFIILNQDAEIEDKRVLVNLDQVTFIDKDPSTKQTRVWFAGFHCERVEETIDTILRQLSEGKTRWR